MKSLLRLLRPLIILAVFLGAVWLLYRELRGCSLREIRQSLGQIPVEHLWMSLLLTAGNYLLLIGYDFLAVRALGRSLSLPRTSLVSFAGFVISYNIGALLGGTSVRYRLYSAWGFSALEIVRLVFMLAVTFWLGLCALAGVVFLVQPFPIPGHLHMPFQTVQPVGWILLGITAVYLLAVALRTEPIRFRGMEIQLPSFRMTTAQMAVSAADLIVAAGCLYVLLPANEPLGFWQFLGVYLFGWVAVVFSHVPGGVGVFEAVMLTLAAPEGGKEAMAASLLAFRAIYYLLPLLAAALLFGAYEIALRKTAMRRMWGGLARWLGTVAPTLLSIGTLLAGAVLLLSTAVPIPPRRLRTLEQTVPLLVTELSHLVSGLLAAALLILSSGVYRRLNSAYWMTIAALTAGMILAVPKGLVFEEAILLGVILAALVGCRDEFYRQGTLVHEPAAPGWISAVVFAVGCAMLLGAFAHKHVEYTPDAWWTIAQRGDASRFLRAMAGAMIVLFVFVVRKWISPAEPGPAAPDDSDLAAAGAVVAREPRPWANLAFLGDKFFLFNEARTAFVMYAVHGRSWVAMGDPVGPAECARELVWQFRALCERFGGRPVVYQASPECSPIYLDQGLTLLKIGEEAHVKLADFSLQTGSRTGLLSPYLNCQSESCDCSVVMPDEVDLKWPQLQTVSDAWLTEHSATEKSFAVGAFEESYVERSTCLVVRHKARLVALANLWPGAGREECAVDLIRHLPDAPAGILEYLIIESILWAKNEGYRWFSLGLAPAADVEDRPLAPLWTRAMGMVFPHGDHFHSCAELRAFKQRFDPVWLPRYLASPGGLTLPRVLSDVTSLIAKERLPHAGADENS
jgi:phosphatidylglycerol lysyltransferase